MEIVLGVSMTPTTVHLVLAEGEKADGVIVDHDVFDVGAAHDSATPSAADQVIAAILGTQESAIASGHHLLSTGVTWTDRAQAADLREALIARGIMVVNVHVQPTADRGSDASPVHPNAASPPMAQSALPAPPPQVVVRNVAPASAAPPPPAPAAPPPIIQWPPPILQPPTYYNPWLQRPPYYPSPRGSWPDRGPKHGRGHGD